MVSLSQYPEIRRVISEQLAFEPLKETRNPKPIQGLTPFGIVWELRFGPHNTLRRVG